MNDDALIYLNETVRKALFDLAEANEDAEKAVTESDLDYLSEDENVTEAMECVASAAHAAGRAFEKLIAATDDEDMRRHHETTRDVLPSMSPAALRKIARWYK